MTRTLLIGALATIFPVMAQATIVTNDFDFSAATISAGAIDGTSSTVTFTQMFADDGYGNSYTVDLTLTATGGNLVTTDASGTSTGAEDFLGVDGNGDARMDPGEAIGFALSISTAGDMEFDNFGDIDHLTPTGSNRWIATWAGSPIPGFSSGSSPTVLTDITAPAFTVEDDGLGGTIPFMALSNLSYVASTPEPSSMALMGLGVFGAAIGRRRRKKKKAEEV